MNRRKTQLVKSNLKMKSDIKNYKYTEAMQNDFIYSLKKSSNGLINRTCRLEDDIEKLTRENKSLKSDNGILKEFYDISLQDKKDKDKSIIELKKEVNNKTKMAQGNIDLNIINKSKCEKYKEKNHALLNLIKHCNKNIVTITNRNMQLRNEIQELRIRSNWDKFKDIVGLR